MRKELYELENKIESPSFNRIKRELQMVMSQISIIDKLDNIEQVKELNLEESLFNIIEIIDQEQSKQENLKSIAFMLANKF